MTVQIVAMTKLNPDANAAVDEYLEVVGRLMSVAGAKLVERFELHGSIVGNDDFQYVSIVDYPDQAAVDSVFGSSEYLALETVKKTAFARYQVYATAAQG